MSETPKSMEVKYGNKANEEWAKILVAMSKGDEIDGSDAYAKIVAEAETARPVTLDDIADTSKVKDPHTYLVHLFAFGTPSVKFPAVDPVGAKMWGNFESKAYEAKKKKMNQYGFVNELTDGVNDLLFDIFPVPILRFMQEMTYRLGVVDTTQYKQGVELCNKVSQKNWTKAGRNFVPWLTNTAKGVSLPSLSDWQKTKFV